MRIDICDRRRISPRISNSRLKNALAELDQVHRLHHDAWVAEGLIDPLPSGKIVRHLDLDLDPNTVILAAVEDGVMVGTNSITLDGPLGVPMDHGLREEVDRIRREGKVLTASWRIATSPTHRQKTRVVKELIEETFRWGRTLGGTVCIYLFAKRHERVYQRLVSARTVCDAGAFYPDAPRWHAVLMRTDTDSICGNSLLQMEQKPAAASLH